MPNKGDVWFASDPLPQTTWVSLKPFTVVEPIGSANRVVMSLYFRDEYPPFLFNDNGNPLFFNDTGLPDYDALQ